MNRPRIELKKDIVVKDINNNNNNNNVVPNNKHKENKFAISTDFELQLPALNTLTSSNTTISTITLTNNKNTTSTNLAIQFATVYTLQLNESK